MTVAFWNIILFPVLIYIFVFFFIIKDINPNADLKIFLGGSLASAGFGLAIVTVLYANDRGWIVLDRTRR